MSEDKQKELYDWETDEELATRPAKDDQWHREYVHDIVRFVVSYIVILAVLLIIHNYFFGPRTYFVSYDYTLEGHGFFWDSGQTFVSYGDKVKTSNCDNFMAAAQNEIERKLHLQDGEYYKSVIVNYQEVPRTLKDLLRFT